MLHAVTRRAAQIVEWIVICAVAALVLDVLWGVIARGASKFFPDYVSPSRWTEEAAESLLMWVALLGAAVAFDRREHLGVDFLASKLHPSARRLQSLIVLAVVAAFAVAALVYGGYILVADALATGQRMPALGIRKGYVYMAAPISGLLILLFTCEQAWTLLASVPSNSPDDRVGIAPEAGG